MGYTRRELLKGIFKPEFWRGAESPTAIQPAASVFPNGQDIVLQQELCIAWGRGVCDKCDAACDEDAILFVGMLHPRIIPQRCTLCSDCVPVCPTRAIAIRPARDQTSESGEPS